MQLRVHTVTGLFQTDMGFVGEDRVTELLEQQALTGGGWPCALGGTHRRLLWGNDPLSREPKRELVENDEARGRGDGNTPGRDNSTGKLFVAGGNLASLRICRKACVAGA